MRPSLAAAAFLAVYAASTVGHAADDPHDRIKTTVDRTVQPMMAKDNIPGMAIGLVVGGKPYLFNYGVASVETRKPVTRDTLFEVGSVSKTFTATLAAYAQDSGYLSLSDKTGKYLPSLKGSPFGGVSLLNLGTHTAGELPLQVPDNIRSTDQLMQYFKNWRPVHAPGTYRTYTNLGIGMLGLITAKSMGQGFPTLMEQRLLPALGMNSTYINVPPNKMPDYAEGYTKQGAPIRMAPGILSSEAYGIRTTATDMIRFVEANMNLVKVDAKLQHAIMETHSGYFKAGVMTQDLIWEQYPYPVALKTLLEGNSSRTIVDTLPATRITPPQKPQESAWINKTGSTNGFGAYVAFVPEKQLGIVILANKNYPLNDRVTVAYQILASLAKVEAADKAPPAKQTVVLQRVPVPGTDRQMGLGIADFPPNAAKPRQKASGPEVCYVLAGEVTVRAEGQLAKVFRTGETFQIPANVVHITTAGPAGAKVLATWVHVPGKRFNTPVPN